MTRTDMEEKITIGISSCLLGEAVRYNGGHKHDRYITGTLSEYFDFRPFCPEVAIGLGIPRPTIRLEKQSNTTRAVMPDADKRDVTDALNQYGLEIGQSQITISGYIFKSKSPSCGMERVKIYNDKGNQVALGTGIYADAIIRSQPLLPVEEEGRLHDADLRDNFLERVMVYHRWQSLYPKSMTPSGLINFHTEHKFLLMAHDQNVMRSLGRRIANLKDNPDHIATEYIQQFMQALKKPATRKNQTNVLQHIAGFFKDKLDKADRLELADTIEGYRHNDLPIIVPLTLIRHHLRKNPGIYIENQRFLEERPAALDTRRR